VEYLKALKAANVTVLCANMDVSKEPTMKDLYKKSMIINIDGSKKIGIIGYIGQDADVSHPSIISRICQ
jgi:2',3'-cyclic-nucleotide 2'-phosphodiesterase (5'-nucleotidase family)